MKKLFSAIAALTLCIAALSSPLWISAQAPGGAGFHDGVFSLNNKRGKITIAAGSNITVTNSGQTITIAGSAGGGVESFETRTGAVVGVSNDYDGTAQVFSTVGATGGITSTRAGIAATATDALILNNTTATTSMVTSQYSPAIHFTGHAWNTTSTAADNASDARIFLIPVSGSTPSSKLSFQFSLNGGGYAEKASIDSAGIATIVKLIASGTGSQFGSADGDYISIGALASGGGHNENRIVQNQSGIGGAGTILNFNNDLGTPGSIQLGNVFIANTLNSPIAGFYNRPSDLGSVKAVLTLNDTGSIGWTASSAGSITTARDVGLIRYGAGVVQVADSSTGIGQLMTRLVNLTTTEQNAIPSPGEGTIIFNTTLHKSAIYANGAWETITSVPQ